MRVLAIGGTGFIGRHIVRLLVDAGQQIAVFHRGETKVEFPAAVTTISGDRLAFAESLPEFERFSPEVVLDVVPYTEQQALDLVQTFANRAKRLVVLSSIDVYRNYDGLRGVSNAPPDPVPLTEESPVRAKLYPYRGTEMEFRYREEYDKILVERAVMQRTELTATVLRLPAVYGPGDRHHRLREYLLRMEDGRPKILLGEREAGWSWSRAYVVDVAAAIALAVMDERAANRIYNVGEKDRFDERGWVEEIARAGGWSGEVVTLPDDELPPHLQEPYDWSHELFADTSRIREELGFSESVSREDALAKTIDWERPLLADVERPDYDAEDAAIARAGRGG
jgi:nucleoside-diphosphate-sugar epimerase